MTIVLAALPVVFAALFAVLALREARTAISVILSLEIAVLIGWIFMLLRADPTVADGYVSLIWIQLGCIAGSVAGLLFARLRRGPGGGEG